MGKTGIVEARIEHIVGLMKSLNYRTGVTGPALAKQWGLSEQYMREMTAEASKRVRADLQDPDVVQRSVCAALEQVLRDGLASADRKWVVSAAKAWAQITGAHAAIKLSVREEPASKMDDGKLQELVQEAVSVLGKKDE